VIGRAVLSSVSRTKITLSHEAITLWMFSTVLHISSCTLLPLRFELFLNNVSGLSLKLNFGLKPEVGGMKIVSNCLQIIHFPSWVAHSHFDSYCLSSLGILPSPWLFFLCFSLSFCRLSLLSLLEFRCGKSQVAGLVPLWLWNSLAFSRKFLYTSRRSRSVVFAFRGHFKGISLILWHIHWSQKKSIVKASWLKPKQ